MTSAALLLWALYPEEPNLTGNAGYQKEEPAYYPGGSDCYPSNLMRLTGREGAEAAIACDEAREQHRLNTNDLIQQRRSADAADAMAVLAYKQAWVAAWGAVFGFLTLCAAVAAAIYAGVAATAAKSALVHAEDAVTAAWQTVEQAKAATMAAEESIGVTREIGEAQVRAYLVVIPQAVVDFGEGKSPRVFFDIRNTGSSPAKDVRLWAKLAFKYEDPVTFRARFQRDSSPSVSFIGGGSEDKTDLTLSEPLSGQNCKDFIAGQARFIFCAIVSYTTVFHQRRRVVVRAFADKDCIEAMPDRSAPGKVAVKVRFFSAGRNNSGN